MESGDVNEICDLVIDTFNKFIAHLYPQVGVKEFLRYVKPGLFILRSQANHFVVIAKIQKRIVGMIEVRNYDHISLLYVLKEFQLKGIGKELLRKSIEICLRNNPDLKQITVNSSPNAVQIYEKLGFKQVGSEQLINGILFTPMMLKLPRMFKLNNEIKAPMK